MGCGCQKKAQFKVLNADGDEVFTGAEVAARAVHGRYPGGSLLDATGNPVDTGGGPAAAPAPAPAAGT